MTNKVNELVQELYDKGYELNGIHSYEELVTIAEEEMNYGHFKMALPYVEMLAKLEDLKTDYVYHDTSSTYAPLTTIEQVMEIANNEDKGE